MKEHLRDAIERDLVISAFERPELQRALNSTRFRGELATVLPSIYTLPERRSHFEVRMAAVRSDPRKLVVTGRAAAKLTWWPELECGDVGIAHPTPIDEHAGFRFEQRRVREDLVRHHDGIRTTAVPLTVLDLITDVGPSAVDEALRRRVTTHGQLVATLAMTPKRRGNQYRRLVLNDSRDEPWSPLERQAHRALREAGIRGWVTNFCLMIDDSAWYLDVAWPEYRLALELDGYAYHGSRAAFHQDRARDAQLTALGWQVLRFSVETLDAMPDAVRAALKVRRRA